MQDARASRLRELDLDVTLTSFSSATTDRHELSRYVLEDLLSCKVGCRFIACIRVSASSFQNVLLASLSWKCCHFRCRLQLVLKACLRVFPTRRPDTVDVSATSCDVGFFFSVSYVVSLPNCRHVVVVTTTTYHTIHPFCHVLVGAICHVLIVKRFCIFYANNLIIAKHQIL